MESLQEEQEERISLETMLSSITQALANINVQITHSKLYYSKESEEKLITDVVLIKEKEWKNFGTKMAYNEGDHLEVEVPILEEVENYRKSKPILNFLQDFAQKNNYPSLLITLDVLTSYDVRNYDGKSDMETVLGIKYKDPKGIIQHIHNWFAKDY